MAFVTDTGAYDRRGVMLEAHRLRRSALGPVPFADCLRLAWSRARSARQQRLAELAAFRRFQVAGSLVTA